MNRLSAIVVLIAVSLAVSCPALGTVSKLDVEINLDALPNTPPENTHDVERPILTPPASTSEDNIPLLKPPMLQAQRPASADIPPALPPVVLLPSPRPVLIPPQVIAPALPAERPADLATQDIAPPPAEEKTAASNDNIFIRFQNDSDALSQDGENTLASLLGKAKRGSRFQVIAYATGQQGAASSARKISLSRALAVRQFFIEHKVDPSNIDVRAMGADTDKAPLDRVDIVFKE